MDVDLVASGILDEDTIPVIDQNNDLSNFDGGRCGICMNIIIDRGVLDCCQHWFCFACIDNWATITNLCPLCQSEFQLITCVPVYDTIGSNKVEDETFSREDDWSIEGKSNTLSFPSYYIDENLSAWMEMAAKFEVYPQPLREIPISIHQLLVTLVIYGTMHFVWDLILRAHQKTLGYAQDV